MPIIKAIGIDQFIYLLYNAMSLLVLPLIVIVHLGGFGSFYAQASPIGDGQFFSTFVLSAGTLIGFPGIGLGSPGNPHIIARYMSIKDQGRLKLVAMVGKWENVIIYPGAIITGMAGRLYFPEVSMLHGSDPENLYPALAGQHLHPVMFGVVIAGIFAAIMSI